ncbi:head-tail adaptor protein [Clostridiaceae bacterium]|jgi:SPP1 family predicted phage head-tail adaptor|nr:phage head closure protein [uncultured Oscillibacter sp.]NBH78581.1 head-tail adaptor protein [Clostridiaceae bacterium]
MDISKLRSRITIQRSEVATDAIGNHLSVWVDYWSCAAYANLASGKEYGAAGQTLGSDTLVFEVRWCERLRDLDATRFRILFGGNIYNITCVDDVQFRHEKLKLTAQRERR